jgi:hypothetical protein
VRPVCGWLPWCGWLDRPSGLDLGNLPVADGDGPHGGEQAGNGEAVYRFKIVVRRLTCRFGG